MNLSLQQEHTKSTNNNNNNNNPFQRQTLQRKNLKHLTLAGKNNNNESHTNIPSLPPPPQINNIQNNMKSLSINDNTTTPSNNNITNSQQFHSLRLRRNFNHNLNINTTNKKKFTTNKTSQRNVSLTIPANAVSFTSSPTSSSLSSSPSSSISSSPLDSHSNLSPKINKNRSQIISANATTTKQENKFNHIQKININTSTEKVIFNNDCLFQLQDMVKLGKIGEGNSGTVTKVLHVPTSTILCKKTIPIEKNNQIINQQLISELSIMKSIKPHPNIISFYGAVINHSINDEIVILMEYMDCGSLDKILSIYKNFKLRNLTHGHKTWFNNPMVISKISYAVLTGLAYLYDKYKIIHRDIKPSNVLINCHGDVKICDFGVSKKMINSIANTFVGTSTYMSPERIQGNVYSTKGDVWSLGLVIIELVTGEFPLGGHNDTPDGILDLLQRIVNESAPCLPINNGNYNFSQEMVDFVNKSCIKDAKLRSSIKDLLSHPFILHYNNNPENTYKDEFNLWCKKVKSKIRKDRQLRKEALERAKLEKRQFEKKNQNQTQISTSSSSSSSSPQITRHNHHSR
ncbi:serine/threonine-protein kinase Ste7p [Monosporozyma unispora]|nr:MAP kinase kinase (MEK) [Kazachstania unispora]